MKIKLPNRNINVTLNTGRIRVGLQGTNPIIPVNECEVTYDDDTCLMYDDNTFAEYE